jgi:hypothetical protein
MNTSSKSTFFRWALLMGTLVTVALLTLLHLASLWQVARLQDSLSLATTPLLQGTENWQECFAPGSETEAGCIKGFSSEEAALRAAFAQPGTWQSYEDGLVFSVAFFAEDNRAAATVTSCYVFRKADAEHPDEQTIEYCFR